MTSLTPDRIEDVPRLERVSCGHEAYQGYCAHCGVKIIDGIAQTPQRDATIERLITELKEVRETIRSSRAIQREDGVNYWLVPDALMLKLRALTPVSKGDEM